MKRILHVSDFHLHNNENYDQRQVVNKVTEMINYLKSSDMPIGYLVMTGDVIDQKYINNKLEMISEEEKNNARKEMMEIAFEAGAEIFKLFIHDLDVKSKNIIIACGNHDILNSNNIINKNNDCRKSSLSVNSMDENFELFNNFCKEIGVDKSKNGNFYSDEGFNFLILNTNYKNSNVYPVNSICVNCPSIITTLNDAKKLLKKNVLCNIVISHVPKDEFCENFKYYYKGEGPTLEDDKGNSVLELINKYFGIFLCGDKHTSTRDNNLFIAGGPIVGDEIVYNILEFDETSSMIIKKLYYRNGEWKCKLDSNNLKEILGMSRKFIKKDVKNYFKMDDNFSQYRNNEKWHCVEELYKHIIKFKKAESGTSGQTIDTTKDVFAQITKIINKSNTQNPISCRGVTKMGKSLFLSFYYMYLLYQYQNNSFDYLPIYINFEMLMQDDQQALKEFLVIVEESCGLSEKYEKPLFIMIDGLSHFKYYQNDISAHVLNRLKQLDIKHKYLFGIDFEKNSRCNFSEIGAYKGSSYILYFDKIKLLNLEVVERSKFFENFNTLFNKKIKTNEYIKFLEDNKLTQIDFDLIFSMCNAENDYCLWTAYEVDFNNRFNSGNNNIDSIDKVCKAAFILRHGDHEKFGDIVRKSDIDSHVFEILKDHQNLTSYALAKYYIRCIEKSISVGRYKDEVLNTLFTKRETQFIIAGIIANNFTSNFINYFEKLVKKTNKYKGLSSAIYILGRLNIDDNKLKKMLEGAKKIISVESDDVYLLNARRSYYISRIVLEPNNHDLIKSYIKMLMMDSKQREINRAFNKYFYEDISSGDLSLKDSPNDEFAFYNTYQILKYELKRHYKKQTPNALIEIYLFTLCNFVQESIEGVDVGFFRNAKYKILSADILKTLSKYLEKYLANERDMKVAFLNDYFRVIRESIGEFERNKIFYNPCRPINDAMRLFNMHRIGWRISDSYKECDDNVIDNLPEVDELDRCTQESIADHILSTYYIGLFYLPNMWYEKEYCKREILDMILIHDIGESDVRDYPPFYSKYQKIKEKEDKYNRRLFSRSGFKGMSDDLLLGHELWNKYQADNLNANIVKDLDKIQMLYKFYSNYIKYKNFFSKERLKDIEDISKQITTQIGKGIYRLIIEENFRLNK